MALPTVACVPALEFCKRLAYVVVSAEAESDSDEVFGSAGGPAFILSFSLLFLFTAVYHEVGASVLRRCI